LHFEEIRGIDVLISCEGKMKAGWDGIIWHPGNGAAQRRTEGAKNGK